MSNLKKYDKFINELNSSTWKSAYKKSIDNGQSNTAKKFKDKYLKSLSNERIKSSGSWLETSEKLSNKIVGSIVFDYYAETIIVEDNYKVDSIFKTKILEYQLWDDEVYSFTTSYLDLDFSLYPEIIGNNTEKEIIEWYGSLNNTLSKIDIIPNFPYITEEMHENNKFANRKSVNIFLKMLEKLYFVQDHNRMAKAMQKINNVNNLSKVENGSFKVFIDNNFGSFKNFKSKLNIRKLYDTY